MKMIKIIEDVGSEPKVVESTEEVGVTEQLEKEPEKDEEEKKRSTKDSFGA